MPSAAGPSLATPPTAGVNAIHQIVARLEVEPFAEAITFTRNKQAPRLKPFALSEVRLGDGPFSDMHRWNAAYMKRLSTDSLLHTFRINAGIASHAAPLGGWEDPKGELRGHFVGHYLSACALGCASAGDSGAEAPRRYARGGAGGMSGQTESGRLSLRLSDRIL